jgi:hypothetical protein
VTLGQVMTKRGVLLENRQCALALATTSLWRSFVGLFKLLGVWKAANVFKYTAILAIVPQIACLVEAITFRRQTSQQVKLKTGISNRWSLFCPFPT